MSVKLQDAILEVVNNNDEDDHWDSFEEWFDEQDHGYGVSFDTSIGKFKHYESERDRDDPSIYWLIFTLTNGDGVKYYAIDGYYDSWNGTTFEDHRLREVDLKTKTVEYWDYR